MPPDAQSARGIKAAFMLAACVQKRHTSSMLEVTCLLSVLHGLDLSYKGVSVPEGLGANPRIVSALRVTLALPPGLAVLRAFPKPPVESIVLWQCAKEAAASISSAHFGSLGCDETRPSSRERALERRWARHGETQHCLKLRPPAIPVDAVSRQASQDGFSRDPEPPVAWTVPARKLVWRAPR